MEPKEFGKNVTLSLGALFFVGMIIFWGTKFFLTQNTLEERVDKKYNRLEKSIEKLEQSKLDKLTQKIEELEIKLENCQ